MLLRSVELVVDNQLLQPGSVVEIETAEAAQVLNRCLGVFFLGPLGHAVTVGRLYLCDYGRPLYLMLQPLLCTKPWHRT